MFLSFYINFKLAQLFGLQLHRSSYLKNQFEYICAVESISTVQ